MKLSNDDIKRFWSKVDKSGDCWKWIGAKGARGYGNITIRQKSVNAHRLSWIIENGDIPKGMYICHHCDNQSCVRPSHLFLGTPSDNVRDMMQKHRHGFQLHPEHHARGENTNNSKLTAQQIVAIRNDTQHSRSFLARMFNVDWSTINSILKRDTWKHID